MSCELCGKGGVLVDAVVEGTSLRVCDKCGGFGKVLSRPVGKHAGVVRRVVEKQAPEVVQDFASRIRGMREKLGLSQKDFALRLNEKEGVISQLEAGSLMPSLELAKKLERLLKIKLLEEVADVSVQAAKKSAGLTIGDVIKVKKRMQ